MCAIVQCPSKNKGDACSTLSFCMQSVEDVGYLFTVNRKRCFKVLLLHVEETPDFLVHAAVASITLEYINAEDNFH